MAVSERSVTPIGSVPEGKGRMAGLLQGHCLVIQICFVSALGTAWQRINFRVSPSGAAEKGGLVLIVCVYRGVDC